jgi:LPS export ABC transporter protein LptC
MCSCSSDISVVKEILNRQEVNRERAENVTIIYSKDGQTKAKLTAKTFNKMDDIKPSYVEMKDGIRVDFFDQNLAISSTLTAKRGRYFEEKGNVLVQDSVEVHNTKGEVLYTEELIWNEKLQRFYSDKFVKVVTPTQIIFGDGLEANQDFSLYQIKNVRGTIAVSKNSIPKLD